MKNFLQKIMAFSQKFTIRYLALPIIIAIILLPLYVELMILVSFIMFGVYLISLLLYGVDKTNKFWTKSVTEMVGKWD